MNVKELIEALSACDPAAQVVMHDPDRSGLTEPDLVLWTAYRVVEGIEKGFSESPTLMRWDKSWSTAKEGYSDTPAVKIIGHNEGEE